MLFIITMPEIIYIPHVWYDVETDGTMVTWEPFATTIRETRAGTKATPMRRRYNPRDGP